MRIFVLALALGGCASTAMAPSGDTATREIAGRVPGQPRSCIDTVPGQNIRALDNRILAYGQGPVLWLNQLRSPCPGVSPAYTVIVESRSGQYCSGDHVRALDQGAIPGQVCFLGDWTPYRQHSN